MQLHLVCSDNFSIARTKLRRAEETSTLETDDDDKHRSRQRRQKTFSDIEEEHNAPPQPKKPTYPKAGLLQKQVRSLAKLPVPPVCLRESNYIALTCSTG